MIYLETKLAYSWLILEVSHKNSLGTGHLIMSFSAMLILYTVSPVLYRLASSAYYNLSLLSSDFYGLLFGKLTLQWRDSYRIITYRFIPFCKIGTNMPFITSNDDFPAL